METPEINEAAELLPQRELTLQRKAFGVFSERRDKFCQALMVRLKGDFCVAEATPLGHVVAKNQPLKGCSIVIHLLRLKCPSRAHWLYVISSKGVALGYVDSG